MQRSRESRTGNEPQPRDEELTLIALGFEQYLDSPITVTATGVKVTGRNFLDAYKDPEKRQDTQDLLRGFLDLDQNDPDYEPTKIYILTFLNARFRPTSSKPAG